MSSRTEQRKSTFKKATDADEARRKRQETNNSIRKDKKDESLLKRRMTTQAEAAPVVEDTTQVSVVRWLSCVFVQFTSNYRI